MKKHIIGIVIVVMILALIGVGAFFAIKQNNAKNLYTLSTEFVGSEDSSKLTQNMLNAEQLYNSKTQSSETRLTKLNSIIAKINTFEQDLSSYMALSSSKASATKKLNKSYNNLSSSRKTLIKNYNEFITRMSGNTLIDGNTKQELYNDILNKTVDYVSKYNSCFNSTAKYVFAKIYTVDTIKTELYTWYSASIKYLLNTMSNNQFTYLSAFDKIDNGINLINNNPSIRENVAGGEFSVEATKFKKHFNNSNLSLLIENFDTYYNLNINPSSETSNEKLAVYYAKQILEI